MPASSRYPTVAQEVISTFEVAAPDDIQQSQTWFFRVVTHTDPLVPVVIYGGITGGAEALIGCYLNQAYYKSGDPFLIHGPAAIQTALDNFQTSCETYRINALSTTGVFVGATLTDQGSIVSSQFVDSQKECALYEYPAIAEQSYVSLANIWIDALPSMTAATMGAHPYISPAREGWYAPQKLLNPGKWKKTNDRMFRGRYVSNSNPAIIKDAQCERWPPVLGQGNGCTYWVATTDDGCSQTFVKGLAPTTTFRITVRMVLELGVTPSNDLASFAVQPPPPDPVAIEMYDAVVSEMIDAYPSVDNDLGKFWGKIKDVASKVVKVIDPVLGVASAAGLPYAKALRAVSKGLSGGAMDYIDAAEDGLKSDLEAIAAEREARKAKKEEAKANLKKLQTAASATRYVDKTNKALLQMAARAKAKVAAQKAGGN